MAHEEGWELAEPKPKPLCPRCADSNGTRVFVIHGGPVHDRSAPVLVDEFDNRTQAMAFCRLLDSESIRMVVEGRRINVYAPAMEKSQ